MSKKADCCRRSTDVQLYDLRREAEMRKARNWWAGEFFPQNADDFLKVAWAMGTQENNWLRQVAGTGAWSHHLCNNGALNEELFLSSGIQRRNVSDLAKIHPFMKELAPETQRPECFGRMSRLRSPATKWGRDRLKFMMKRVETMREKRRASCVT